MKQESKLFGEKQLRMDTFITSSAVYFLYNDEEVVYVGKTMSLSKRIMEHIYEGNKIFNNVRYTDVAPENLNDVETMFIKELKPHFNAMYVKVKRMPKRKKDITKMVFRVVVMSNHQRKDGSYPVRIRCNYQRKSIWVHTDYMAYDSDRNGCIVVSEKIIKALTPKINRIKNAIKNESPESSYDYIRDIIENVK